MKEILVAKLNKEELKTFEELGSRDDALRLEEAEHVAQQRAFWVQLKRNYRFDPLSYHYIKEKAIYTQVI